MQAAVPSAATDQARPLAFQAPPAPSDRVKVAAVATAIKPAPPMSRRDGGVRRAQDLTRTITSGVAPIAMPTFPGSVSEVACTSTTPYPAIPTTASALSQPHSRAVGRRRGILRRRAQPASSTVAVRNLTACPPSTGKSLIRFAAATEPPTSRTEAPPSRTPRPCSLSCMVVSLQPA